MVPAGEPTEKTLDRLASLLSPGDTVIDGGNSNYRESARRAADLESRGLRLLDAGTSGGVWGLTEGYCLTIGGGPGAVSSGCCHSSARSRPPMTAATSTRGRPAPATSSRWCTTASSTG